jgi:hypothetical protein
MSRVRRIVSEVDVGLKSGSDTERQMATASGDRGARVGSALEWYAELRAKVDAFFARVRSLYPDELRCGPGCSDCCHARFSVALVEAAAMVSALAALPAEAHLRLASRARDPKRTACAALDERGRCAIYEARPLVCRSHGLPVRTIESRGRSRLPVIATCPRNFGGGARLATLGPDPILDQETLSTVLAAIDAAYADEIGAPRGVRIELDRLFEHGERALAGAGASR